MLWMIKSGVEDYRSIQNKNLKKLVYGIMKI